MTDSVPRRGVPLTVYLQGLRVVVVGAGPVAATKLRGLLEDGADVHVIAPDAAEHVRAAAAEGQLTWHRRPFAAADLDDAVLALAATNDPTVNAAVADAAAERSILCVRADGGGTAAFVAAVRRGPLMLTVSTGGAAPALARRIREEVADRYGSEHGMLAVLLGELRGDREVRHALATLPPEERRARWRSVLDADILALIRAGRVDRARELARSCLLSSSG